MNYPLFQRILETQPYPLLFVSISGAHLYGFPSPNSDYDLRGVHLLPLEEVVGLNPLHTTIEQEFIEEGLELDIVSHDIQMFFELMLKKNGLVLEQIFSPLVVQDSPFLEELRHIAPNCITRHHAHHYLGLMESQWKLFQRDKPRRIKPLLYVYRSLLTGIHLVQSGQMEANLPRLNDIFHLPYLPDLIARKMEGAEKGSAALSAADLTFHEDEVERLRQALHDARDTSTLPEVPSAKPALNDLLIRTRLKTP